MLLDTDASEATRLQLVEAQLVALIEAIDARSSAAKAVIDQALSELDANPDVVRVLLSGLEALCCPLDVDMQVFEAAALDGARAAAEV